MKWSRKIDTKKYPENGVRRLIRRFLTLPTSIGNEVRWLEFAWIDQAYRAGHSGWNDRNGQVEEKPGFWWDYKWAECPRKGLNES